MKTLVCVLCVLAVVQAGFFDNVWSTISDGAKTTYDAAKSGADSVANSDFGKAVGGVATDVGDTIASGAKTAWDKTGEVATDVANSETGQNIAKGAKSGWESVSDAAKDAGSFVADKAVAAHDTVVETVHNA